MTYRNQIAELSALARNVKQRHSLKSMSEAWCYIIDALGYQLNADNNWTRDYMEVVDEAVESFADGSNGNEQ